MKQQLLPSLFLLFFALLLPAHEASFFRSVDITWGAGRGKIVENGNLLQLSLDRTSGSGFRSKQEYMFGKIDMRIKVVPGNSAGTITAFYLSSQGSAHDEIDFEFLGNTTGEPYTLHTNLYSQGKGGRERQFKLWFDPRDDFHTYSILWNPTNIIWYVDGTPLRVFKNVEARLGVAYPKNQPMNMYSSIWNGEKWATRGGRVKIDWSYAPFVATYRNFTADACVSVGGGSSPTCPATRRRWWGTTLDAAGMQKLREVRRDYMIYDYCRDTQQHPECSLEQ